MESQISNLKSQIRLKVCGLTKLNQISELVSLKVDFLGFIFYEKSPRFVLNSLTLNQISEIEHQGKVGVFVNETLGNIIEISQKAGLQLVQLHGDENVDFIIELKEKLNSDIKLIKVFRIGNDLENLKFKIQNLKSDVDYFLFDTDSKSFGGTGNSFDWQILNDLEITKPYFLSGGISEKNIDQLSTIRLQPFSLDINSKFEIEPGNKDLDKIKEFQSKIQNL